MFQSYSVPFNWLKLILCLILKSDNFLGQFMNRTSQVSLMCQICDKAFENADSLSKHRFEYHSETFSCNTCQEVFYSIGGLTRHENKAHQQRSNIDDLSSHWSQDAISFIGVCLVNNKWTLKRPSYA